MTFSEIVNLGSRYDDTVSINQNDVVTGRELDLFYIPMRKVVYCGSDKE